MPGPRPQTGRASAYKEKGECGNASRMSMQRFRALAGGRFTARLRIASPTLEDLFRI